MKKTLIIIVIALVAAYVVKRMVVDPYLWKKAIATPEHALKLGSFVFSKRRGHNGSQSMENQYFVFKVTELHGDHVRLAVIRKMQQGEEIVTGEFSTTKEGYAELKDTVRSVLITGISRDDLFSRSRSHDGSPYKLDAYLLEKYPALKTSRYYFEDVPENKRNRPVPDDRMEREEYFTLVYSKKEIIEHGRLVGWILNNSPEPELSNIVENIDLILN